MLAKGVLILALGVPAASCFAGSGDYQCVIQNEYHITEGGQMNVVAGSLWRDERFAIDRATGKITGGPFVNHHLTKPAVIDRGSDANAFKVASTTQVAPHSGDLEVVHVMEYARATRKPFVALVRLSTYSGYCD